MSRKVVMSTAIFFMIIAVGIGIFMLFKGMKKPLEENKSVLAEKFVSAELVFYDSYSSKITAYGRLAPISEMQINSEVQGTVLESKTSFKVGSKFKSGEVLVRIDDEEARLNLYSLKSDFLNVLTKMMPDIKADFINSFEVWETYLNAFEIESNLREMPSIKSKKEKYFLAGRNIYKLFYSIKNAELKLSKYIIKAPFNGSLTESMIVPGQILMPGQKVGTLSGTDMYELELQLNEKDRDFVSLDMRTAVTFTGMNDTVYGKISRISSFIDQKTQTISIFVRLNSSKEAFRKGMYLKGIIYGSPVSDVCRIPRKSLYDDAYVYVIEDQKLAKKEVELVRIQEEYAFIRGLDAETVLINEPLLNPIPGTVLKANMKGE